MARLDVRRVIVEGDGRTTASGRIAWMRHGLVIAQVALCVTLLIGAGLLVRTFVNLVNVPPGIETRRVIAAQMSLRDVKDPARVLALYDRTLTDLRALPGVEAAAVMSDLPLTRGLRLGMRLIDGPAAGASGAGGLPTDRINVDWRYVTPDFLAVLRVPVIAGRAITERDAAGAAPVALSTKRSRDAISPRVRTPHARIAAAHARATAREPRRARAASRAAFAAQGPADDGDRRRHRRCALVAERAGAADGVCAGRAGAGVDLQRRAWLLPGELGRADARRSRRGGCAGAAGDRPPRRAATAAVECADDGGCRRERTGTSRSQMLLLGIFAGIALALAAAGLYGLVAYTVAQRTREIGIHMALGATAGVILRRIVARGLLLTLAGLIVGLGAATITSRWLENFLVGVKALDPLTFVATSLFLIATAAIASLAPAVRAARINPMAILRNE